MDPRVNETYEQNEVAWWANWAEITWLSKNTYVMLSTEFPEPFFNRVGFLSAEMGSSEIMPRIESVFKKRKLHPLIYVQETEEFVGLKTELVARGYVIADSMSVMEMREPSFHVNDEIEVVTVEPAYLTQWCETYLLSFYGETGLLNSVLRIARKIAKRKEVSLVLAKHRGSIVGTLALFESQDVIGAYCVGTLPAFRSRGVATEMMCFAYDFSRSAGRQLILQTMLSDRVEGLYAKMGLQRRYLKRVFTRP